MIFNFMYWTLASPWPDQYELVQASIPTHNMLACDSKVGFCQPTPKRIIFYGS